MSTRIRNFYQSVLACTRDTLACSLSLALMIDPSFNSHVPITVLHVESRLLVFNVVAFLLTTHLLKKDCPCDSVGDKIPKLPVKDSLSCGTKFGVLQADSAVSAWRVTSYDTGTFSRSDWIRITEMPLFDRVVRGENVGHMRSGRC
jgi:hypothetical protein